MRPKLLDLFCGAGGAAVGYHRAGFDVVGVDNRPQPHYPFEFVQADALQYAAEHACEYAAVHASPPCQAYTLAQRIQGNDHPDLINAIREILWLTAGLAGRPYVIENVEGAPLLRPVLLCGAMFPGLAVYRHRLFEASVPLLAPAHPAHTAPLRKMGRPPQAGDFMHVVGNFSGVAAAKRAMGIGWMTRDELRESIPPAYTEHVGRQLLAHLVA
jgi:DNA (cytosine-5)-methyltransferase 1